MAQAPIPRIAAAIAYAELNRGGEWTDPAELWAEMDPAMRRLYRDMATAALKAIRDHLDDCGADTVGALRKSLLAPILPPRDVETLPAPTGGRPVSDGDW